MNLETLRTYRPQILRIAERCGADELRVFGSVARGDALAASDVDLLVHLRPQVSLLGLIAFQQEVSDLLQTPVDVLSDAAISPYLAPRILRDAVPL